MGGKTSDIILVLVGLIVIGTVIIVFFGEGEFFTGVICKMSIYFADQSHGLFPAVCYTEDKVIEEENKIKVMREVAEYMRKCWSMWGEGNLNPEGKNLWYDDEFKCFKCYRLKFSSLEGSITVREFQDFLEEINDVRGYEGSYWNYFNSRVLLSFKDETYADNMIKNDQYYAVTFVEHMEKNRIARYAAAATTGGTIFGGACMFIVGVGWIASPACVAAGGTLGLIAAAGEQIVDSFIENDEDSIMFSGYGDVGLCAGHIS